MKKITCIFFSLVILSAVIANAQQFTITLKPDACNGKDALIGDCVPCGYDNSNFGLADELSAIAWTNSGNPSNARSLIQFDLSTIPPASIIVSAQLYLYHNPSPASGNPGHSTMNGPNDAWLQRITSPWGENSVTWNNQPATTTQNQVALLASTIMTQDYLNINVSALVQDMIDNPSQSFGFLFSLQTETYYRSLLFASSDFPNAALHPQLVIQFLPSASPVCIDMKLDSGLCGGVDALIGDCVPCGYYNSNFGLADECSAIAWTNSGNPSNARSLLQFDLGNIPPAVIITNAVLSLFHNPNPASGNPGHSVMSGPNDALLQRITSPWSEFGVTWNSQPATTTQNEVTLPASTLMNQDYLNINVTALVQDMVNNPLQSFGFMLKLQNESYYRSMLFASSDHPDVSKHPVLLVCFIYPGATAIAEDASSIQTFSVYPNPAQGTINFSGVDFSRTTEIKIYNSTGALMITSHETNCDISSLSGGLYYAVLRQDDGILRHIKFVKE